METMMKRRPFYFNIITILCILFAYFIGLNVGKKSFNNKELYSDIDTCYLNHIDTTLNFENVYQEIKHQNIECPDVVIKQAILETGNFTSNVCKTKHNLFGFLIKEGYLKFNNWRESVIYYKKWQQKRYKGGDYYQFLSKIGYAEDTSYENKLKNIKLY